MSIHSGETAKREGDFICMNCNERVFVNKGEKIPRCPFCGCRNYDKKAGE